MDRDTATHNSSVFYLIFYLINMVITMNENDYITVLLVKGCIDARRIKHVNIKL